MDYMSVDGLYSNHEYESHRASRLDVGAVWQYCLAAAEQYVGIYAMMRDPRRILIQHKWALPLARQIVADVFMKAEGEHITVMRMSMVSALAVTQLKGEKRTFTTKDIAERAYRIVTQPSQVSVA